MYIVFIVSAKNWMLFELGLYFCCSKFGYIFSHFYVMRPESGRVRWKKRKQWSRYCHNSSDFVRDWSCRIVRVSRYHDHHHSDGFAGVPWSVETDATAPRSQTAGIRFVSEPGIASPWLGYLWRAPREGCPGDPLCVWDKCGGGVATWRSGNSVGSINEVTLRQARLVLGWVTCPGSTPEGGTLFRYVTSHAGRLSLSCFRGR